MSLLITEIEMETFLPCKLSYQGKKKGCCWVYICTRPGPFQLCLNSTCPNLPLKHDRRHNIAAKQNIRGGSVNGNEVDSERKLILPSNPHLCVTPGGQETQGNEQPFTPLCTLHFIRGLLALEEMVRVRRRTFQRAGESCEALLVFVVVALAGQGMDESFQAADGRKELTPTPTTQLAKQIVEEDSLLLKHLLSPI